MCPFRRGWIDKFQRITTISPRPGDGVNKRIGIAKEVWEEILWEMTTGNINVADTLEDWKNSRPLFRSAQLIA